MRRHLDVLESLEARPEDDKLLEAAAEIVVSDALRSDLTILTERLREYMAPESGDEAVGVETGMQRAADMLENVLRRHGVK